VSGPGPALRDSVSPQRRRQGRVTPGKPGAASPSVGLRQMTVRPVQTTGRTESGVRSRPPCPYRADVAELADATDLGSVALRGVEVQILSSALAILDLGCSTARIRTGPWPSGKAPALHAGDRRFESGRVHLQCCREGRRIPAGKVQGRRGQRWSRRCPLPFPASVTANAGRGLWSVGQCERVAVGVACGAHGDVTTAPDRREL
jgi:hypothetical protein